LSTDPLIDFFTCSENLAVTKSFTPNCLAPCKINNNPLRFQRIPILNQWRN